MSRWVQDSAGEGERGDAVIEFVGLAVVVLVPLIYLIVTLATLQGAALGAHSGAREAERILAADPEALPLAQDSAAMILADQGVEASAPVALVCHAGCAPDTAATITVGVDVPLPLLPAGVAERVGARIHVEAHTVAFIAKGAS